MFISILSDRQFVADPRVELQIDQLMIRTKSLEESEIFEQSVGAMFIKEPKMIGFRIWHGDETGGNICGIIEELQTGDELKVSYSAHSAPREVTFSVGLAGIEVPLNKALSLTRCSRG